MVDQESRLAWINCISFTGMNYIKLSKSNEITDLLFKSHKSISTYVKYKSAEQFKVLEVNRT